MKMADSPREKKKKKKKHNSKKKKKKNPNHPGGASARVSLTVSSALLLITNAPAQVGLNGSELATLHSPTKLLSPTRYPNMKMLASDVF